MQLATRRINLTKRHPLTISRGTMTGSVNVIVSVSHDGVTGIGEMAPSEVTGDTAESCETATASWADALADLAPSELQRVGDVVGTAHVGSAARAALDLACHDWTAKRCGLPLWQMLGIDRDRTPPTSITIGIDAADVLRTKVPEILARTRPRILKVKLGQPAGIEADRSMFSLVQSLAADAGFDGLWRVDANGGWTPDDAVSMTEWLAARGVDMVEQPIAQGQEQHFAQLNERTSIDLFADESIRTSHDVADLAHAIDGVNLKLMKCGGIAEALRIIHTAKAHGLKVMIGCMGESSLAISAGAQLGGLVDALDLDSHLNLLDDPFIGATYKDGRVVAGELPGLGASWREGEQG